MLLKRIASVGILVSALWISSIRTGSVNAVLINSVSIVSLVLYGFKWQSSGKSMNEIPLRTHIFFS
jgi:hypothetical protein